MRRKIRAEERGRGHGGCSRRGRGREWRLSTCCWGCCWSAPPTRTRWPIACEQRLGPSWKVRSGPLYQAVKRTRARRADRTREQGPRRPGRAPRLSDHRSAVSRSSSAGSRRARDTVRLPRRPLLVKITFAGPDRLARTMSKVEDYERECAERLTADRGDVRCAPRYRGGAAARRPPAAAPQSLDATSTRWRASCAGPRTRASCSPRWPCRSGRSGRTEPMGTGGKLARARAANCSRASPARRASPQSTRGAARERSPAPKHAAG